MIHLVGIGPGDPELLTVKASRLLQEADIIYVPQSREDGRSVARDIIAPYGDENKIEMVLVPMREDRSIALNQYKKFAAIMAERDKESLCQVFVTLGDPMVYSTAKYLSDELGRLGVAYKYTPGIPSFAATANFAGVSLGTGRESFAVVTMPDNLEKLETLVLQHDTLVIMKINKKMPILMDYVNKNAPKTAIMAHRLGMQGEELFDLAKGSLPDNIGYLSTAIIRKN